MPKKRRKSERVKAWWISYKPPRGKRFAKLPEPFKTKKAADNYIRRVKERGDKFKVQRAKRVLKKGLRIRSS